MKYILKLIAIPTLLLLSKGNGLERKVQEFNDGLTPKVRAQNQKIYDFRKYAEKINLNQYLEGISEESLFEKLQIT